MEDMARLALIEQNVRNEETFGRILYELLRHINYILENPHDYELRVIKGEPLKQFLKYEALVDYLKSIGFQLVNSEYTYPKEFTLSNLRMAQAAIERKIYFCCGPVYKNNQIKTNKQPQIKPPILQPVALKNTSNQLLLKLEAMFNSVLQYEDEELQALAREHIPLVSLQLMALDEMREQQMKIKTGQSSESDMTFDVALLRVLLVWFKARFFSWVDTPQCDTCGTTTALLRVDTKPVDGETCRVELYECSSCSGHVQFPRYNSTRTLLRTRRGRCGEWANCFALQCRALGYDTRLVFSTSDHVWCEVWDYDSGSWLHLDPCEAALDAPLLYAVGWRRPLTHVLAVSRDDLQDVTWRYTVNHKQVLQQRIASGACDEAELVSAITRLRAQRQSLVSEPRRRYLARRCAIELAQMLTERKVTEREVHGRSSGGAAWRVTRGETRGGHVFTFSEPGHCQLSYCAARDRYEVENGEDKVIETWQAGVYSANHVFRKEEKDWKMVYLAREEGSAWGSVSWAVSAAAAGGGGGGSGAHFSRLCVRAAARAVEDGRVDWTLQFDDQDPAPANFSDTATEFSCRFSRAVVCARLSGGRGREAWQHAQLFRVPLATPAAAAVATAPALVIQATLHRL